MSSTLKKHLIFPGARFGKLVVITPGRYKDGYKTLCRCECGIEKMIACYSLIKGATKSCGCLNRAVAAKRQLRHGRRHDPIYSIWGSMIGRCTRSNTDSYPLYGGRGIKVCKRWMKFENFLADMGERPEGMTLERIDSNGNYEPSNCRWASKKEQANNRRTNIFATINGQTKSIWEWSGVYGIKPGTAYGRKKRHPNMPWEEIFDPKPRPRSRPSKSRECRSKENMNLTRETPEELWERIFLTPAVKESHGQDIFTVAEDGQVTGIKRGQD